MNKNSIITLTLIAFSIATIFAFQDVLAATSNEIVAVTIDLQTILLEPNQVIPLLDTKSVGNMSKLQISATLPCESNNTPKLKIVAGALGNLTGVIDNSSDYKNLRGPFDSCYYEGTISTSPSLPVLNKVFLKNDASSSVVTNLGTIVTLTGALDTDEEIIFDTTGLKAYYQFDNTDIMGSTLKNKASGVSSLGSNADGTISGATTGISAVLGNAFSFDGVDDYVDIGTSTSQFNFLHNSEAKWSVVFWANVDSTGTDVLMDTTNVSQSSIGTSIRLENNDSILVTIHKGVVSQPVISTTSSGNYVKTDGNWHLYAVTYDQSLSSDNLKFYRDGGFIETATKTSNSPTDSNASYALRIGDSNAGNDNSYDGQLDELSIWNRVLSNNDINVLYNNGNGLDLLP